MGTNFRVQPGAPEINLLDNARTVSFTVTLPGIYTLE